MIQCFSAGLFLLFVPYGNDVYRESYEKFKYSNFYSYLTNFVKRSGLNYSDEDLSNLQILLRNKGLFAEQKELQCMIDLESEHQGYLNFIKPFQGYSPKSLNDLIKIYVKYQNKELKNIELYSDAVKRYGIIQRDGVAIINIEFLDENGAAFCVRMNQVVSAELSIEDVYRDIMRIPELCRMDKGGNLIKERGVFVK